VRGAPIRKFPPADYGKMWCFGVTCTSTQEGNESSRTYIMVAGGCVLCVYVCVCVCVWDVCVCVCVSFVVLYDYYYVLLLLF